MMDASLFGLSCGDSAALVIMTAALIPVTGAILFFTSPKKDDSGGRKIKEVVQ